MSDRIILDSGPLGMIAHPRPNREIAEWFRHLLERGTTVMISEIADYEIRRSFLLEGLCESVRRLDQLKTTLAYLPLTTEIMLKAAQFWAEARRSHQPTADPRALDIDVILAAQALKADAIIATEDVGHLTRFVEAKHWKEIG